ncbi:minichromosome maintenance-related protein [Sparganum proliferum]
MRSLGYPPGWLNKARVEDLPSFNEEKQEVSAVKYKVEEIIEYPGFNVFSSKLRESCHIFGCPPIQRHHLIQNFVEDLQQSTHHESKQQTDWTGDIAAKDLDSLEAERQRILAEINNLKAQSSSAQDSSPVDLTEPSPRSYSRPISVSSGETNILSDPSSPDSVPSEERNESDATALSTKPAISTSEILPKTIPVESDDQQSREEEQPEIEETGKLTTEEEKTDEAVEEGEGTTIPISFRSSCTSPTGSRNSAIQDCCEKKPRIEAFSAGIQPFMPFVNLPGTQGTYLRVRESLKRARSTLGSDCQKVDDTSCVSSTSVPSTSPAVQETAPHLEPQKTRLTSTYSESRQTTIISKSGWVSERVDHHRTFTTGTCFSAPPSQDNNCWPHRKSSSEKSSWRPQADDYAHSGRHRDSRDDRSRDYHCPRGSNHQDEGYDNHLRDSLNDHSRGSRYDCNRNPPGYYGHRSRGDAGRDSHRSSYHSHSRSPYDLPAPPRRYPEYSAQAPYRPYCPAFVFYLDRLRPEPVKRPNWQPADEAVARKRVRQESSAIARRRAAADIALTAEEINEFLAHSDDDEDGKTDDEAGSDASSDWDAIQEETVEQFLSAAASSSSTQMASTSLSTIAVTTAIATPSAEYRDVGVERLFCVANSQQPNEGSSGKDDGIAGTRTADDEAEDLLALTGANPDDLNEFGAKVQSSLAAAARDRRDRRVERDVKLAIQTEEASATVPARDVTPPASPEGKDVQSNPAEPSATTAALTDSQRLALKLREEKRKRTLAALGKSPASGAPSTQSTTSGGNYFVATPTNIRVMRPLLSSELWTTRTAGRRVFSLAQFLQEAARAAPKPLALQTSSEFVVVGVVGTKTPPRRSKNDKIYSIWRLTDMAGVGTGGASSSLVSLFLFGSVHEKLWKEPEGTVVAILKPKLMSPSDMEDAGREVSITVDSAPFVMVLGISPDFGTCAGMTKSNKPCSRIINKSVCRYCDFHVKSAYYAASSIRPGFSTTSFPWTGRSNGRGGRGGGRSWTTGRAREIGGSGGIFSLPRPATMPLSDTSDKHPHHPGAGSSGFVRPKLSLAKLTSAGYSVSNGPTPVINTNMVAPAAGRGIAAQNALTPVEQTLASQLARPSLGSRNLLRHLEKQNPGSPRSPSQQANNQSEKSANPEPSPTPPAPAGTFANFFAGRSSARTGGGLSVVQSPPVLGRGLQGSADRLMVDLGPVVVSSPCTPTTSPAMTAARMRAEALVRARGGVARLEEEARKSALGSRVSELVARSRTTTPSPLSELLDNTPSNDRLTKSTPGAGRSEAGLHELKKSQKEAERAELARLLSQGSQYAELVELEADLSDRSLLCRLEKRDEFEERLLAQHEQECQIVTCKTCNYRSLRADRECRKQGHILEFSTGTRRFFACRNCKTRTTTLDRYPTLACKNCGDSLFEKAGAIAERKGPKLPSEKLLARGLEEKFLS